MSKRHYIYKTICTITNRFYIGMHSTSRVKDHYLGSGKILKQSINKYGKENHEFEILENYETREALSERETELVNEDLLKDPLCMNIKYGGDGGWAKMNLERNKLRKDKTWEELYGIERAIKMKEESRIRYTGENNPRFGKEVKDETRHKIGKANTGTNNGMYGSKNSKFKGRIFQYDKDLNPIKIWDDIYEIKEVHPTWISNLYHHLNGNCKTTHGYIWKLENDQSSESNSISSDQAPRTCQ